MKWYRHLYLGKGIRQSKTQLIQKAETNAGLPNVYLITLAANGRDLLDIFRADLLFQPILHGRCPMIVGAAKGYDEAVGIASDIVQATYQKNADFDVRRYLRENLGDDGDMFYEYPMDKLKKKRRFGFRQ